MAGRFWGPIDSLATIFANSSDVRAFLGAADVTEALAKIYVDEQVLEAAGETATTYLALFPLVHQELAPDIVAESYVYEVTRQIQVAFVQKVTPSPAARRAFDEAVSAAITAAQSTAQNYDLRLVNVQLDTDFPTRLPPEEGPGYQMVLKLQVDL